MILLHRVSDYDILTHSDLTANIPCQQTRTLEYDLSLSETCLLPSTVRIVFVLRA